MVVLTLLGVGWFWREESKEGGRGRWLSCGQWSTRAVEIEADRGRIRIECRVEINFDLNLILKQEACKRLDLFLKFVLAIFPAKRCNKF
jgi:hypothetical protein